MRTISICETHGGFHIRPDDGDVAEWECVKSGCEITEEPMEDEMSADAVNGVSQPAQEAPMAALTLAIDHGGGIHIQAPEEGEPRIPTMLELRGIALWLTQYTAAMEAMRAQREMAQAAQMQALRANIVRPN